ncbi:MAG: tetratricopeptide repeat protein [Gemmatimonadaceae bacterium]
MFRLNVLGPPSLHEEHRTPPPGAQQKRRLGLLALVTIAGDRGISRDQLQCFLWPESTTAQARHALDQLVYSTRRSLHTDPFISEGGMLRLDDSTVTTDLHCFEKALAEERPAEAAALYKGPLLDGFHIAESRDLEDWIDAARAKVAREFQKAVECLARAAAVRGDHAEAASWWLNLGAHDRLSSRVALEIITSLAASGDSTRAINYARAYQQRVRLDLESEPDPRVEQVITSLKQPPAPVHPRAHRPRSQVIAPPEQPLQPEAVPAEHTGRLRPAKLRRILGIPALTAVLAALLLFLKGESNANPPAPRNDSAPHSPEARELYLRGMNAWSDRSKEGLDTAVVYFHRAIELDPAYAEAYAGLGNSYVLLGYSGYRPAEAMFPKAKAAALRAIDLDSTLASPYATLGMELTGERYFNGAESAFRTAIARDPRYATAHQWYGILLMILGRVDEAVRETGRAAELDPLSLQIQNTYATFLSDAGNHRAALEQYQKVVGEEPDSAWVRRNPWLLTNMAAVYRENGQYEKALRLAQQSVSVAPHHPRALLALASVYLAMHRPETAREVFSHADTTNEQFPSYRAFMYLAEKKPDSAFIWFDRVKKWGIPVLVSLQDSPELNDLGADPRRRELFRRVGLAH